MPKLTKALVDKDLRERIFAILFNEEVKEEDKDCAFEKINDRQYGIILTDLNGDERYIRLGAIVADNRDDMTAREYMQSEQNEYTQKQADKAEKAKAKADKIAADKAKREAKAKEEE